MFLLGIVISDKIVACWGRGYFILNTTENGYLLPSRPDTETAAKHGGASSETNIWIWIFPISQAKLK